MGLFLAERAAWLLWLRGRATVETLECLSEGHEANRPCSAAPGRGVPDGPVRETFQSLRAYRMTTNEIRPTAVPRPGLRALRSRAERFSILDEAICRIFGVASFERQVTLPSRLIFPPLENRSWPSSPRGKAKPEPNPREKLRLWRFGHGIARATEDLRGLRLPLVPRPERRERLLPGL